MGLNGAQEQTSDGVSSPVEILLTNDDGIYAPGLEALERQLQRLGKVTVVAPATEQSGVGHSITFLSPLICKEVYEGDRQARVGGGRQPGRLREDWLVRVVCGSPAAGGQWHERWVECRDQRPLFRNGGGCHRRCLLRDHQCGGVTGI